MYRFRNLVLAVSLVLALCIPSWATITVGNAVSTGSSDHFSVTTSSIDTTGATIIWACSVADGGFFVPDTAMSDNKGNVWYKASDGMTVPHSTLWVSYPTTVGTGHTFTFNLGSSNPNPSLSVMAGSGTSGPVFDKWSAFGGGSNFSQGLSNTITPSANNAIIVTCGGSAQGMGSVITSGFTTKTTINTSGGNYYASGLGYEVQTTATARNPEWDGGFQFGNFRSNSTATFLDSVTAPPYTIVAKTIKISSDNISVTTDAVNTTSATAFLACVGNDGTTHNVTPVITDSASNSWTCGTYTAGGESGTRLCYVNNPTTSSSHTFSMSGGGTTNYPVLAMVALSLPTKKVAFDQTAVGVGQSLTPASTGSMLGVCNHFTGNEAVYVLNSTNSANSTGGGDIQPFLTSFIYHGATNATNYNFRLGLKYLSGAGAIAATYHPNGGVAGTFAEVIYIQGDPLITCPMGLSSTGAGCE